MDCAPDPANFDFHDSYRALLCFYRPYLTDGPFHFTPRLVQRTWSMLGRENVNRDRINYPRDLAFINQLCFGVSAILARLNANVACRPRLLDFIYGDAPWPVPFTSEEIAALEIS